MKTILSFDGGGVRGAIAVAFLARIEEIVCGDSDAPLAKQIDLSGGTSTGAIIAGAVALGHSAEDIREFYLELAPRIFQRSWARLPWVQSVFDAKPLEAEIDRICGDRTLESADLQTGFALIMKRMDTGSPWIVSNNPNGKYWDDPPGGEHIGNRRYRLADLIRASTAAPHYFTPETIDVVEGELPGLFVDGGFTPHNNPSLALLQLVTIPAHGYGWETGADRLRIVSIGTGMFRETVDPAIARRMTSAMFAVKALAGMINDCEMQILSLMQSLSHSPTAWEINSEIGDLSGTLLTSEPLLDFLRYDVRLDADWLKHELGIPVSDIQIERLCRIDDAEIIPLAYEIGVAAAERFVKPEHFGNPD